MNENLTSFLSVLDPDDLQTGGGTASAVAGAMAGALVAMVARLSVGKEGMEPESFYAEIADAGQALSKQLFDGGRADSLAFEAVRKAFRLPKQTADEKIVRRAAIQAAWIQAARIPLSNAEGCTRVLELAQRLKICFNKNATSDLTCGILLAQAGALGCLENVEINVPSIKEQEVAEQLTRRAKELRELALGYGASLANGG